MSGLDGSAQPISDSLYDMLWWMGLDLRHLESPRYPHFDDVDVVEDGEVIQ